MKDRLLYIAGKKTSDDWYNLRTILIKDSNQEIWKQVFEDYFLERLNRRYFDPIRILQENSTFTGEGFSIMAILCTLVEFLETTIRGLRYRYVRNKNKLAEFEYCSSRDIFVDFLSKRVPFSKSFDEDLAFEFYKNIRCGLLHEAQTKDGWSIWADSIDGSPIDKTTKIVYRNDFQRAFTEYIEEYKKQLLADTNLQKAFIRKFDFICEEA